MILKKLELTFAILKPHVAVVPFRVQDIHNKILKNGFYIIRTKISKIDISQAHQFYVEHKDKFFFNRLTTFMCSGPCFFHILARENAIQTWRSMMGPTKVFQAVFSHPDSIRAIHGISDTRNATHGSDSVESAEKEIKFFFPEFSIPSWYTNEELKFIKNECKFDPKECIHVLIDKKDNSKSNLVK